MPTNLTPRNAEGQPHGYWEVYFDNGNLSDRGNYVNGKEEGTWEVYFDNGNLYHKGTYKNGQLIGLSLSYDYMSSSYIKKFYAN